MTSSGTGRRPRVLLVAEAANPEMTSVPLVGYSHAMALREVADVHLVTQVRNRDALVRAGLVEGRDFTAIDSERVAAPLSRANQRVRSVTGLGWTFTTAMAVVPYAWFEKLLWDRFGPSLQAGDFDLVHRLTPLSPTIPSVISGRLARAGVPFVWGPVNGGIPWPTGFGDVRRREGEWLHSVRDVHRLLPGHRATRRNAAALIMGSRATHDQLDPSLRGRAVYIPENAVDLDRFPSRPRPPRAPGPLRMAVVGRLVAYKGLDIVLDAAAELLRDGRACLDVIGDGPERASLEAQVCRLGVGEAVRMRGWVLHGELSGELQQADVLSFPSLREFGGAVVLEAMALGVVPVVADYGGPAELVTDRTGFRVPLGNRTALVARLREVLTTLAADPSVLGAMARAGRRRVEDRFTWSAKAAQTAAVYRWVLEGGERPSWGMPFEEVEPAA